jgi:hypothetical protein
MPSFDSHLNQATHNAKLISAMVGNDLISSTPDKNFSDWYSTISFYSSVHYLEALFYSLHVFIIFKNNSKQRVRHSDEAKRIFNEKIYSEVESHRLSKNFAQCFSTMRKGIHSAHQARKRIILDNPDTLDAFYEPYGNLEEVSKKARYFCFNPDTYNTKKIRQWLTDIESLFTTISSQKILPQNTKNEKWAIEEPKV